MELIRGLYNCTPSRQGCVATIGNFDGVHCGHQAIFKQVIEQARQRQQAACVISFQPLPREYFNPGQVQHRLQTLRDKASAISASGIDRLLILRFNKALAQLPADDFIQQCLVDGLGVSHLVVGDDFKFGNQRQGNFDLLQRSGEKLGFSVVSTASVIDDNHRISSSAIRSKLTDGDCEGAAKLLGRSYTLSGRVIKGEQIGRQLGYPTANIGLKNLSPPMRGVFAVKAQTANGERLPGVANLGERPTVNGRKLLLEVHLFDYSGDLYGQLMSVEFEKYLRAEKKFDSLDDLKAAIAADADAARAHFSL